MPCVLGDILNADQQSTAQQRGGVKFKLLEQAVCRRERERACELTAPHAFTPDERHLLAVLICVAGVGEPFFHRLLFFKWTTEQLGKTLILEQGSPTLIEYKDSAGHAFKIGTQPGFAAAECLLRLAERAQFLFGAA